MQFSRIVCFVATGIATVSAIPTGHSFMRRECDIGKCVVALGPIVAGCAPAIAKKGADLVADASCLAGAANARVNPPVPCVGCGAEFADKLPKPVQEALDGAEDVIGDVFEDVKEGLGDIF